MGLEETPCQNATKTAAGHSRVLLGEVPNKEWIAGSQGRVASGAEAGEGGGDPITGPPCHAELSVPCKQSAESL